jgi:aminopeptidase N
MKYFYLIISTYLTLLLSAQTPFNDLEPPNTFQNADNPYYWKNKLPFPGYWQQDVHYKINADIDEKTHILSADMELTYWNNSPDTLYDIFFHLYQNAFQPNSYYDQLHKSNKIKPLYGLYEHYGLGTLIEDIKVNKNKANYSIDNTIMHVELLGPLEPGKSINFEITFKTFFDMGSVRRRMDIFDAYGFKHFNGVHWYPRISVYDRKFGWTTDQHLGREFYGDFGTFDISLTFANNYIVEATGQLQNKEEVMPESLRKKLDIANFKDKPWGEAPSIIVKYDSTKRKTWHYHAENVHDFAFTADPTYRIGETITDGIQCISLVQESHAAKWQNASNYTAKVVDVYNKYIGMYAYPKIIVADARDGMEYPMITLDSGKDPSYRGLLAHEVGHNWFFGMVGNNETYRAALDEGFTQFLTSLALESIDGEYVSRSPIKKWYARKFKKRERVRDARVYIKYLKDAMRGEDPKLNTHSDDFGGKLRHGGGYGHVYYKTATMLYNLQYVLGDSLFFEAMQNYFQQWSIAHPYLEDFRNSIIHYTKFDLNWFFDQWLETNKYIDYSLKSVKKDSTNLYNIVIERKGSMQMPLDILIKEVDGAEYELHIPNKWYIKPTDAYILPKWEGWGKLVKTYEFKLQTGSKLEDVIIDPSNRLADVNKMNNHGIKPIKIGFDSRISALPNWRSYEINWRPIVWANRLDGILYGIHLNGNYMNTKHNFKLNLWQNGVKSRLDDYGGWGVLPKYYDFSYQTHLFPIMKGLKLIYKNKYLEGLRYSSIGINKRFLENSWYKFSFVHSYRPDSSDSQYLLLSNEWETGKRNNYLLMSLEHPYKYTYGNGKLNANFRTDILGSDFDYSYVNLSAVNNNRIGKLNFRSRFFAQLGMAKDLPSQSALFFASANPDEMMNNPWVRSEGAISKEWAEHGNVTGHFHHGGGLNLRGYSGYKMIERNDQDSLVFIYKGTSGLSINTELEFGKIFPIKPRLFRNRININPYLFGDAGTINRDLLTEKIDLSEIRMDAGIGMHITIKTSKVMDKLEPLKIRLDFPLFLSHAPYEEQENIKFRWLIGVSRAF